MRINRQYDEMMNNGNKIITKTRFCDIITLDVDKMKGALYGYGS